MSDVGTPSNGSQTSAPAPVAEQKTQNMQSTSAPSGQSGQKQADPVKRATDEVFKSLQPDAKLAQDSTEDVEDDGSDLEVDKPVTKAEKKAWKLKVGDKDIEITDEAEMIKRAQMGYSAEQKWQEASKMRKQVEGFIGLLQKDPSAALEKLGFNVDELAEKRIQQRIEEMKKSPEQLELERLRRDHESILSEREQERQTAHQREMERMQNDFAVQIENDITSALESPDFGLPKSPYFIKRIADVLIYDIQKNKKQTISAKQAAEVVRDEVKSELQQIYSLTPDEVFEQLVGKDRLNKYRRSKIKKPSQKPVTSPMNDLKPTGAKELNMREDSKPKEKVRSKDFFKTLGTK